MVAFNIGLILLVVVFTALLMVLVAIATVEGWL